MPGHVRHQFGHRQLRSIGQAAETPRLRNGPHRLPHGRDSRGRRQERQQEVSAGSAHAAAGAATTGIPTLLRAQANRQFRSPVRLARPHAQTTHPALLDVNSIIDTYDQPTVGSVIIATGDQKPGCFTSFTSRQKTGEAVPDEEDTCRTRG
ncbi:hypothetical protein GCM10010406_24770 [Streptomyces thermolineatus]|uniref:Uncharacterized protein n=1 Tax=Streptomyces thermolineatus TaxID=44033 RepID=A0ABN3LQE6_9ACTN